MRLNLDPRRVVLGPIEGIILALGLGAKAFFGSVEPFTVGHGIVHAGILAGVINLITSFSTGLKYERAALLDVERTSVISRRGVLFQGEFGLDKLRREERVSPVAPFSTSSSPS